MRKKIISVLFIFFSFSAIAQLNTDRIIANGRVALYYKDYFLSIQYFNQVIKVKPYLSEPYMYRAFAKLNLSKYDETIAYILSGDKKNGLLDLSKAGELGIHTAYNIIKRYS